MQVGTTKDQGLYNKPSAAVRPGPLATGTLPQYSTIQMPTGPSDSLTCVINRLKQKEIITTFTRTCHYFLL